MSGCSHWISVDWLEPGFLIHDDVVDHSMGAVGDEWEGGEGADQGRQCCHLTRSGTFHLLELLSALYGYFCINFVFTEVMIDSFLVLNYSNLCSSTNQCS